VKLQEAQAQEVEPRKLHHSRESGGASFATAEKVEAQEAHADNLESEAVRQAEEVE
jgi:hypothetical protein